MGGVGEGGGARKIKTRTGLEHHFVVECMLFATKMDLAMQSA